MRTRSASARLAAALAGMLLLAGCALAPRSPQGPWWRALAEPAPPEREAEWARWHWYFPEMRHTITARAAHPGSGHGALVHVRLEMAAKALTSDGAAVVGTLRLEGWNADIVAFEVIHLDSTGAQVPLPAQAVRKTFLEKGLVVVPRVARGSTVAVRLVRGPYAALDAWELPMERSAPVRRGRVALVATKRLGHAATALNGLQGPVRLPAGFGHPPALEWRADDVAPLEDLPYADASSARPRLLLVNRDNLDGTVYFTWKGVARQLRRDGGYAGYGRKPGPATRALAARLAEGVPDAEAKARALLAWVQDNIGSVGAEEGARAADGDALIARGRGTPAQAALLLRDLFSATGLRAAVVLSRARPEGGFAAETVNPRAAETPFVLVQAGARTLAAWPHDPHHGLGDYPAGFYGLAAVDLGTGAVAALPTPVHAGARLLLRQEVAVDFAGRQAARRAEAVLEGPFAARFRAAWTGALGGSTLDACRASLRDAGFAGGIRACSAAGIEDREGPLRLALELGPGGSWVEEDGRTTLAAPDLFLRPAWFYDSARTEAYFLPHDVLLREEVTFRVPQGRVLEDSIPCREAEVPFLSVACRREAGGAFVRETVLRRGRWEASALRARHADLAGLDRIREARLVARAPEPARRPAGRKLPLSP